jgi:Protein of unknown function (DUF2798)
VIVGWAGPDHVGARLAGFDDQLKMESMPMRFIPRCYSHFAFGVIQSGLTSGIAAAIASVPFFAQGRFLANWLGAWAPSWLLMLPIVILAAPVIRSIVMRLTRPDE